MSRSLDVRFERYCGSMTEALKHADRAEPTRWYLKGLMLQGGRKSVEPMAARLQPDNVRALHQSMHHLVAQASWSDEAMLSAVAHLVLPTIVANNDPVHWIIDDTGLPKKGTHSVGVAHQYCGQTGKQDNCRVAVTLSIATDKGSIPVGFRLYLPREWTDDPARCRSVGVPEDVRFATKPALALQQIEAAQQAGYPTGTVIADAAYGCETSWRERIEQLGLKYAVCTRGTATVWWGRYQPRRPPARKTGAGRPRSRTIRDATHQPIAVEQLARELPAGDWRTVAWREGTAQVLRSRFARVRVQVAHENQQRAAEWLIIEWPSAADAPAHYWLSNLPEETSLRALVGTVMSRWQIERDYQELKQELGLGHYEGRSWLGFHHHASLCIAAYGFLMLERLVHGKKNAPRFAQPALPEDFRPRGAGSDATTSTELNRNMALPTGTRNRPKTQRMSVLRRQAS